MEEPSGNNSSTLQIQVTSFPIRVNKESNEMSIHTSTNLVSSRNLSPSEKGSHLETGSTNIARSNSMRTSRWDESMPKHLEPRPPMRPVRKTISRSLSPRPRKPISLANLRPPPPSPTWSGKQEGFTSPTMLLPTRSPTPPQVTGTNASPKPIPIQVNINNKHLETFTSTGWSSAPTTPTSIRKTLDVPGRVGSGGGSMLKNNCFVRNDRSTSTSPTRDSPKSSSRIPRIDSHLKPCPTRTDSHSPSRYLDNLSSRQKRGESPVIISDKKSDKYNTSPLILEIRKKQDREEKNIGGVKLSNLTPPTNRKLGSSSHDAATTKKDTETTTVFRSNLHSETRATPASPRTAKTNISGKTTSTLTPPTLRKIGNSSTTRSTSPSTRKVPSGSNSRPSTPTTSSSPHMHNTSSSSAAKQNLYLAPSPKSPSLVSKFDRSSGRIKTLAQQILLFFLVPQKQNAKLDAKNNNNKQP